VKTGVGPGTEVAVGVSVAGSVAGRVGLGATGVGVGVIKVVLGAWASAAMPAQ
jgi:hypothetical protein